MMAAIEGLIYFMIDLSLDIMWQQPEQEMIYYTDYLMTA